LIAWTIDVFRYLYICVCLPVLTLWINVVQCPPLLSVLKVQVLLGRDTVLLGK